MDIYDYKRYYEKVKRENSALIQELLLLKKKKELVDFSDRQLGDMYLGFVDLSDANLSRSKFAQSNLSGAKLVRANLENTFFIRAILENANLNGANLSGANLTGAKLDGANLSGANLNGADLTVASLRHTKLSGANLNGVLGLDTSFIFEQDLNKKITILELYEQIFSVNLIIVSTNPGTEIMSKKEGNHILKESAKIKLKSYNGKYCVFTSESAVKLFMGNKVLNPNQNYSDVYLIVLKGEKLFRDIIIDNSFVLNPGSFYEKELSALEMKIQFEKYYWHEIHKRNTTR